MGSAPSKSVAPAAAAAAPITVAPTRGKRYGPPSATSSNGSHSGRLRQTEYCVYLDQTDNGEDEFALSTFKSGVDYLTKLQKNGLREIAILVDARRGLIQVRTAQHSTRLARSRRVVGHRISMLCCLCVVCVQGFNMKLVERLGYVSEELLGQPIKMLMSVEQEKSHGSWDMVVRTYFQQIFETGRQFPYHVAVLPHANQVRITQRPPTPGPSTQLARRRAHSAIFPAFLFPFSPLHCVSVSSRSVSSRAS